MDAAGDGYFKTICHYVHSHPGSRRVGLSEDLLTKRTRQTNGCASRMATLSMLFQLARVAEGKWLKLNGSGIIGPVIQGEE